MKQLIAPIVSAVFLASCVSSGYTPVVDLQGRDNYRYAGDLLECQQLASQRSPTGDAAMGAVGGALLGAAVGGLVGYAYGAPQRGLAYGASGGALAGGVQQGMSGAQAQKQIVQRCLAYRGYRVLG